MNFFRNLGLRERLFVIGAGAAVLLALLFMLVIDPMLAHSARLDQQIIKAQRDLQDLRTLQREYQRQKSILDDVNAQLKRQKNFSIFSRLEELAGQTGVRSSLLYIKPAVSTPSDAYEEEAVEIKLENVTLEQLTNYLYQIENSPQFMKIKRLYIKPRSDNRQILSAIFRVSTFTPKAGTS
jgi:type II secretory pathway component PulM